MTPLILTLQLHLDDQARFDALRQRHFPPGLNHIPAHVTLFHHLPGIEAEGVAHSVQVAAQAEAPFPVHVTGLRSLGGGVAYAMSSAALARVRSGLARHWHEHLTGQDRQGFRPHVTIQNKVEPAEAKALLAAMQAVFTPFQVRATGLVLWRYMGGPWELSSRHPFLGEAL